MRDTAQSIFGANTDQRPVPTLGQNLDARIEYYRKEVEKACILKAKAEATGLLNTPMDFINNVAGGFFI